jgi:hypothetical protein
VDPTATLQQWLEAVLSGDEDEAGKARRDYAAWREHGGYAASGTIGKLSYDVDKLQAVGRMRVLLADGRRAVLVVSKAANDG